MAAPITQVVLIGGSSSSSATGTSTRATTTQSAHGFVAGDVLYSVNGTWTKAKADALSTTYAIGVVESAPTVDTFVLVYSGVIVLSALAASSLYYLSDATAGAITNVAPTTITSFVVPILRTGTSTAAYVNIGTPAALAKIALTTDVTGTLPIANGGSGIATTTPWSPLFSGATATGAWKGDTGPGTATQVLTSNGPGAYPTWQAAAAAGSDTIISPTQLAADTDDWSPTGLSTATIIRIDTDANLRYVSSIVAQSGHRVRLYNISVNTLILKDQSAALGTAANRLALGGRDLPLFPGVGMDINYDATLSRWVVVNPLSYIVPPMGYGFYSRMSNMTLTTTAASDNFALASSINGTAAAVGPNGADTNSRTTFMLIETGTTNTGRAAFAGTSSTNFMLANAWYWRHYMRLRVPTASDGTETYTIRAGFIDTTNGDAVDGVYFRYTHSVNSGNFEGVIRNNSTETAINLTAGPTFSSTAFFTLTIVITPTRVEWYKDGVSIGSTTTVTNLPTARNTDIGVSIIKSAGTTDRVMHWVSTEVLAYAGVPTN